MYTNRMRWKGAFVMKSRVMCIALSLILVMGMGVVPSMRVKGAGKSIVGVRSARMYQSGQCVYFVSNCGGKDGIYKYDLKTKKKKKIHNRIMGIDSVNDNAIFADSLLVDGGYLYVFGFVYDDEYGRSCVYRLNTDGSGKKLLFKCESGPLNYMIKSGKNIYVQTPKKGYYQSASIHGVKGKKVKIHFSFRSDSPKDGLSGLKTGKIKYSVSKDAKRLFCGGKKIYSCSGSEFIYDISVHKKSVYVVISKTDHSKFTTYYMNSNGLAVKKLNSGCMAG